MEERLQKILSRAGYGSRRACESIIIEGRVQVNGKPAELGMKVDPYRDRILIDGAALHYDEPEKRYIALNKPRFVLSDRPANDPRQTVFSLVPDSDDLFVVGRLDFESEGLVLLTNDGELANKLSHPRYGKEKEYQVLVAKRPDEDQLTKWRRGVILEDGERTEPADVRIHKFHGDGAWLRVIMREGRKREIREIGKRIGLPIVKLVRIRIGTLWLGRLEPKEWAYLKDDEVKALRELVAKKPIARATAKPPRKAGYAKTGAGDKRTPFRGAAKTAGSSPSRPLRKANDAKTGSDDRQAPFRGEVKSDGRGVSRGPRKPDYSKSDSDERRIPFRGAETSGDRGASRPPRKASYGKTGAGDKRRPFRGEAATGERSVSRGPRKPDYSKSDSDERRIPFRGEETSGERSASRPPRKVSYGKTGAGDKRRPFRGEAATGERSGSRGPRKPDYSKSDSDERRISFHGEETSSDRSASRPPRKTGYAKTNSGDKRTPFRRDGKPGSGTVRKSTTSAGSFKADSARKKPKGNS